MKLVKFNSLEGMKVLNFINVRNVLLLHFTRSVISLILIALFLISCNDSSLKTGYVDINQINREYKLAIEFEKYVKSIENEVTGNLIGLQAEMNLLHDSISNLKSLNIEPNQILLKNYFEKRKLWEKNKKIELSKVQDSVLFYREKLINNINSNIAEFSKINQFHYVFSPLGSGTFLYGDSSLNITKEVIYYLNSK